MSFLRCQLFICWIITLGSPLGYVWPGEPAPAGGELQSADRADRADDPMQTTQPIPKKLHFIWMGGPLPQQYADNIIAIGRVNPDYELHIWTDQPHRIENGLHGWPIRREASRAGDLAILQHKKQLPMQIHNITEITKSFGHNEGIDDLKMQRFFAQEIAGKSANYAATSDILRYYILLKEGGVYVDTDTRIIHSNSVSPSPHLLKESASAQLGDLTAVGGVLVRMKVKDESWELKNNDLIASVPGAPMMLDLIREMNRSYQKLEQGHLPSDMMPVPPWVSGLFKEAAQLAQSCEALNLLWVQKRQEAPVLPPTVHPSLVGYLMQSTPNRVGLTMHLSGPEMLNTVLSQRCEDSSKLGNFGLRMEDFGFRPEVVLALEGLCHGTWFQQPVQNLRCSPTSHSRIRSVEAPF